MKKSKSYGGVDEFEYDAADEDDGEQQLQLEQQNQQHLDPDEKKIKEEIVLIGEKCDIESLLDNENNQLYNLIMANSMRAGKLNEIESAVGAKRYAEMKKSQQQQVAATANSSSGHVTTTTASSSAEDDDDDDYDIEIEINERVKKPVVVPYEVELRRLAKYLVDEITKISLNKVKIDYINETLDKKYFNEEQQLITTTTTTTKTSSTTTTNETLFQNLLSIESGVPTNTSTSSSNTIESLKTKEEIFNYYESLEQNLKQVRGEIDKLKEEAYQDLVYINQILSSSSEDIVVQEQEQQQPKVPHLEDIDHVYLRNDTEEEEADINNNNDDEEEEGDEEETQYLSQPVSQQADSSQVYMTPAESWQTLQNHSAAAAASAAVAKDNEDKTLKSSVAGGAGKATDTDNETDLDQDEEKDDDDDDDETTTTLQQQTNSASSGKFVFLILILKNTQYL